MLVKGDSTRLPGKNTLPFHGKPMFVANLEKCLKIFDEVFVSSEDQAIRDIAWKAGATTIPRPIGLCGDTPNIPVYQHAMTKMRSDGLVAVQANSPTIEPNIIALAKHMLEMGIPEVMTMHPDRSIYGSVWGILTSKLANYPDPYDPHPEVLIRDTSLDIHTQDEYEQAVNNS